MQRHLTYDNIVTQKFDLIPFEGDFQQAFGNPSYGGVWFIWGDSGCGKSSLIMQLAKQFALFGNKVLYNALEEYKTKSYRDRAKLFNMAEVKDNWGTIKESIDLLDIRLKKRRSADVIIIDSIQYFGANRKKLMAFFDDHKDKTIIISSQAEKGKERGSIATDALFEAYMKIFVDKHVAYFKGREAAPKGGGQFVIWQEEAEKLGYKKTA